MNTAALLWGLWVISGGPVNSGSLTQVNPPVAYFQTVQECEVVREHLRNLRPGRTSQCIQARYMVPK